MPPNQEPIDDDLRIGRGVSRDDDDDGIGDQDDPEDGIARRASAVAGRSERGREEQADDEIDDADILEENLDLDDMFEPDPDDL
jgi:hypothetical protein